MLHIGTSGYNYPEWKGSFYPSDLPAARMLAYYAERFTSVEINYTFYRMPTEKILAGWAAGTPDGFTFTLKAPRRITHDARLKGVGTLLTSFCNIAQTLGPKLGALLFQLPPNFKKDVAVLDAFLQELPPAANAAFEFRHASWFDDEVFDALRRRRMMLCIADSDKLSTPVVSTADSGYFRLRDEGYVATDIDRWASIIQAHEHEWQHTYVYFKHEEEGKGPEFAQMLIDRLTPGGKQETKS